MLWNIDEIILLVLQEKNAAHLPDDRWDKGYRAACDNIVAILESIKEDRANVHNH